MENSDAKPLIRKPEQGSRLILEDRGPFVFALYWYSFRFHMSNEPPQRAMSFFGISSTLRTVLMEKPNVATLARRFDLRARVLMAICFIPGLMCLSASVVLCGLPGYLAVDLHNQFPMLVGALVGLSFLSLALLAIFTRDLYRSFKGLFEAYNAPAETVAPDAANGSPAEAPPDQTAPPNPPSPPDQTDQPATP